MSLSLPQRPPVEPALPSAAPPDAADPGLLASLVDFATANTGLLSLAGGLAVALILGVALLIAWVRGKVAGWIVAVSWIAAFGFSAEGMWYVATDKAHVPPVVAAGVFFVFELFQIRSMLAARQRYRATTVRDEAGKVIKAGDPGKHGRAVWYIALAMGSIVAVAAHNIPDALLRLSIPLAAALLWWNDLTDDGVVRKASGSLRWTPRRLALWLGAIEPAERDMVTVDRDRRIDQMTATAHKLHHGSPRLRGWRVARLRRLAQVSDDGMVAEVRRRVSRIHHVEESTRPGVSPLMAEVTEPHRLVPFALDGAALVAPTMAPAVANGGGSNGAAPVGILAKDLAESSATRLATDVATPPAKIPATDGGGASPTSRQSARQKKADDDVTKHVTRLAKRNPNITAAAVAEATGLSERTASRRLAEVRRTLTPKE